MNPETQRAIALARANVAPRCLAKNRRGLPCQRPACRNQRRCHLHGGAARSGAPPGNKNRWLHGRYDKDTRRWTYLVRQLVRSARSFQERE
ncbi:HGGxSTG domain-containing protein [Terricaulis sp.]|uniref:HGGxSTG domain-containing protein n=1 Tax=Terricaulis sp. TaxID=2768686 RepID=UPI003A102674